MTPIYFDPAAVQLTTPPFDHNPETAPARRAIVTTVAHAREQIVEALAATANTFEWGNGEYWIDATRWVVIPGAHQEGLLREDGALAATAEADESLDVYAGPAGYAAIDDFIDLMSFWLVGPAYRHSWYSTTAGHALNVMVVQPLVNPAAWPLLWVVLAEAGIDDASENVLEAMAPMMFDMRSYPESRAHAASVRAAQIEFVRRHHLDLVPPDAAILGDEPWAQICNALVARRATTIDINVFEPVMAAGRQIVTARKRELEAAADGKRRDAALAAIACAGRGDSAAVLCPICGGAFDVTGLPNGGPPFSSWDVRCPGCSQSLVFAQPVV